MSRKTKRITLYTISILAIIALAGAIIGVFGGTGEKKEAEDPVKLPTLTVGNNIVGKNGYISFLGDSITTYEGWSNNSTYNSTIGGNGVYYDSSKMSVLDTWWHQTASELDMSLCVNNSWDGGRVTDTKEGITPGTERAKNLHNDKKNISPDVIIVYLGTNDVANDIDIEDFKIAYVEMLTTITNLYSEAEVFICTILPESRTVDKSAELTSYNTFIRSIANANDFGLIDFYNDIDDWDYTVDTFVDPFLRVHPTADGMDKLTKCAISSIKG